MFVAEYSHPELTRETPWRRTVDSCVAGLSNAGLVVAVLLRRWGRAIPIDELGLTATSFLEIELFHASLRRIPTYFLVASDYTPELELARLIAILRGITGPAQWVEAPEREFEAIALKLIDHAAAGKKLPPPLAAFPDGLSDNRSFRRASDELRSTRLSMLGRFAPTDARGEVSHARVQALLTEARDMGRNSPLNYADRLTRLWIALRELSKVSVDELSPELAVRWSELAELWASPAAWLRLHGPLNLGALAALQTRSDLAQRFNTKAGPGYGAFASEFYSIGKVSTSWRWRARWFKAARSLASQQARASGEPSGAWLIRASVTFELARLGRPWLFLTGRADYAAALKSRERAEAGAAGIGEAMVELGFADFLLGRALFWRRREALARMREGVRLMEADRPGGRPGFVKRAKIKLAIALEEQGFADEAAIQRAELADFNPTHGLPAD